MAKKAMVGILIFLMVAVYYHICWSAEDYETKLRDVRYKKAQIEQNYKKELAEVNQKGENDLKAIKKDFHAKRDERLNKLSDDQKTLKDSYEAKVAPLIEEEKTILQALTPSGSNFVKTMLTGVLKQ